MPDDPRTQEFLSRLAVEDHGDDHFTGTCYPAWPGRAFGGQLAAQTLQAAAATTPSEAHLPWSLHMYFHAPVTANEPIDYEVVRIKEGATLASRQVRVVQGDRLKATSMVLLGVPAEGPEHQYAVPPTLPPGEVPPEERLLDPTVVPPEADYEAMGYPTEALVEVRVVRDEHRDEQAAFQRPTWMRVTVPIPDDAVTTATALCYLSDITLGTTALEPHGGRAGTTDLQLGAIELCLWFTGPARLDDWTLFAQDSVFAGRGHGLAHGTFYASDGTFVGAALQNALMRRR